MAGETSLTSGEPARRSPEASRQQIQSLSMAGLGSSFNAKAQGRKGAKAVYLCAFAPSRLCVMFLQSKLLQPAIERAPAKSECFGGLAHASIKARERPLDQIALDLFKAHILEPRRALDS